MLVLFLQGCHTQGIQGNSGIFQVEKESHGDSGNFDLFLKPR